MNTTIRVMCVLVCVVLPSLPAQETVEKQPKVVILFDVSASMNTVDGPAKPGVKPATLPSRQEQVVQFLTAKKPGSPFLEQILKKANVSAYRFGATLDERDVAHFKAGETWNAEQWRRWLKADDRTGTNAAGAALQMLQREKDNYVQAIVIVSDGRSNRTTAGEIEDFLADVNDSDRPIPVFTIGVGQTKSLPRIRIPEISVPAEARPGDSFRVRVPVAATGLAGEPFSVTLEVTRVLDGAGKKVAKEETYVLPAQKGLFKGAGDQQQGFVEFEVNLPELMDVDAKKDAEKKLQGKWQLIAKVARHKSEAFAKPFHVSEPAYVQVQQRALRVLLFAGAATREYRFVRTLFYREMLEKRVELCIFNQAAGKDDHVDQDVEPEAHVEGFPERAHWEGSGKAVHEYDRL